MVNGINQVEVKFIFITMSNNRVRVPISWIDTSSDPQNHEVLPNLFHPNKRKGAPDDWYTTRFPMVIAAKEWNVDRTRTTVLPNKKKPYRVRIEVRRKSDKPLGIHGYRDLEEGSTLSSWSDLVIDGDMIVFSILKEVRDEGSHGIPSSRPESRGSISTIGIEGVDDQEVKMLDDLESDLVDKWAIKYSVPISKASIKREHSLCYVTLGSTDITPKEDVTLNFASDNEAKSFVRFVGEMKMMHNSVAKEAMKSALDTRSITSNINSIDFLIEIISATDLQAMNNLSSDPFVRVRYGGDIIHTTEVVTKSLNPIWTIKTKCMFIFALSADEYYNYDLVFEVLDFETFTTNKMLGQALLTNEKLIKSNGQRIEMKLKNLQMEVETQGFLAIRCKRATAQDIEFVGDPYKSTMNVIKNQTTFIQPLYSKQNPLLQQLEKWKMINGNKYYYVRPMSPLKDEQWMTKEEINVASKEKSMNWTEVGSGDLIQVFLEVLSCDDLPNLDRGLPTNKTDAFATLVCEDAVVSTEVIRDTLNPRFMPWTRRAFKFNVRHVSSPIYIGVFDHDQGGKYDSIGRITIPLQRFRPNTEYNLSYDLYNSSEVEKRKNRGKINIRLSIKWVGQRKVFFDSFREHEQFTVNIESKNNYNLAKYTVLGYHDQNEYNIKTILSYACELIQYQLVFFTIIDGLKTVLLWRGHYKVNVYCFALYLPIHSVIMMTLGAILIELPGYSLSVFFASIAWLMLACLEHRRRRPSSLDKPPFYRQLLLRLITGNCRPATIAPFENMQDDIDFRDKEKSKHENYEREIEEFYQRLNDDLDDLDQMKKQIMFKDAMKTKARLEIFKKELHPVQFLLGDITYMMRLVDRIMSWDHT